MQNLKRIVGGGLAILVIGNKAAAEVGREYFRCAEMLSREARLACPRRADENNHREFRNRQFHWRVKIPICVGLPTVASSGPTGKKRTAYPNRCAIPSAQF